MYLRFAKQTTKIATNKHLISKTANLKPLPGFTLIELLIVISIVGILAVVGINSYRNAMRGVRDDRRRADITAIQQALERMYAEEGTYPWFHPFSLNRCDSSRGIYHNYCGGAVNNDWESNPILHNFNLAYLEAEGYIDDLPRDPLQDKDSQSFYQYYAICAEPSKEIIRPIPCGTNWVNFRCKGSSDGSIPNTDLNHLHCCAYSLTYFSEKENRRLGICKSK